MSKETIPFLPAMREKSQKQARGAFRSMLREQNAGNKENASQAEGYGYGVVWTFNELVEQLLGPVSSASLLLSSNHLIDEAQEELDREAKS